MSDGPKVLIADDEPSIVLLVANCLRSAGMQVIEAHDGPQLVARAASHRPDVILTDISMPGLNGLDAILAIQNEPALQGVPICVFSGLNPEVGSMMTRAVGALLFLPKPLNLQALPEIVRGLAKSRPA